MFDPITLILSLAQDHKWILYVLAGVYGIGFIGSHLLRIWFPIDRTPFITKLLKTFDAMNLFFGTQSKELGLKRKSTDADTNNKP